MKQQVVKLLADAGKSSAFGLAASGRVLRGLLLLIVSGLMSGVSHSLGAKALGIRVPDSWNNPDDVDERVLNPTTPSGSLGTIVQSILAAEANAMVVTVDLHARKVHSRPAVGVNAVALIDAVTGTSIIGVLKAYDDKRVTVWIDNAATGPFAIDASSLTNHEIIAQEPQVLSRSVAALISALEDDYESPIDATPGYPNASILAFGGYGRVDNNGNGAFIVVDQVTARVTLIGVQQPNVAAVRALFNVGGSLADEERYEQIPAAEAAGATRLAFE